MNYSNSKHPSLFSAIAIGVSAVVGSGWLFASYYAAKFAGPISVLSWIIGAGLSLVLALLLAEISTMYQERGLFSRLLTISHNRDFGFILAISNWFAMVILIPSEAIATVQYASTIIPSVTHYVFFNEQLTIIGIILVCLLIIIYGIINYWGIQFMAKTNNIISTIKLIIPVLTGLIIINCNFHIENFYSYKSSFAPYGVINAFKAVTTCGIFYAFFGFSLITIFAKELKNPKKNIPIALVASVIICLIIYLILQIAFIGAMEPNNILQNGWTNLQFTSPLAQLAILLGMNWLALILYCDSALSPSGTAIIYAGSGTRMLSAMAEDKQFPKFFSTIHHKYELSRNSLIFTIFLCCFLVLFFDNWQKIMIVVTVFQIISCLGIPIAFSKLRISNPGKERVFKMPYGNFFSILAFTIISYLLLQCGVNALLLSLLFHIVFFLIYCVSYYKFNISKFITAFKSSYTMFFYIIMIILMSYIESLIPEQIFLIIFFIVSTILFFMLIRQK